MKKNDLEIGLKAKFESRAWHIESVSGLPPAFVSDAPVTPFFQPRVIRRSDTHYLIDGYLGVVSRAFEKYWLLACCESAKHNSHCLALNIANVDSLRAEQHIDAARLEETLFQFANLVLAQLSKLPCDEISFRLALDSNTLMGLPLEKFAILGRSKKLSNLRAFMETFGSRPN